MFRPLLFFLILCAFYSSALAGVTIPQNLNSSDRIEALKILGFGTSSKVLSNPYPLGGYSGVEIGVAAETFETKKLSTLGNLAEQQDSLFYPTFSFGKGLYSNVDVFIHFTPFFESISLSRFGAMVRWGFFQSEKLPFNLSLVVHGGSANIDNKIISTSYGLDVLASFQLWDVSLYGGVGQTYLRGTFIGDSSGANDFGVTDSGQTETESANHSHIIGGVGYGFNDIFITLQADLFENIVFSGRVGLRY